MHYGKVARVGAAGTVLSFVFFTTAAALSKPDFAFLSDYLSELGISGTPALFFNAGLAITAIFMAIFFAALARTEKNSLLQLAACFLGIVCAAALAGAAIYSNQVQAAHATAVYAFFSTAAFAVLLSSLASSLAKNRNYLLLALMGALEVISTALLAVHENAFLQVVTATLFGAWIVFKAFYASDGK